MTLFVYVTFHIRNPSDHIAHAHALPRDTAQLRAAHPTR
jgi:hypothetical protein